MGFKCSGIQADRPVNFGFFLQGGSKWPEKGADWPEKRPFEFQ